jgi:hypothetical protein
LENIPNRNGDNHSNSNVDENENEFEEEEDLVPQIQFKILQFFQTVLKERDLLQLYTCKPNFTSHFCVFFRHIPSLKPEEFLYQSKALKLTCVLCIYCDGVFGHLANVTLLNEQVPQLYEWLLNSLKRDLIFDTDTYLCIIMAKVLFLLLAAIPQLQTVHIHAQTHPHIAHNPLRKIHSPIHTNRKRLTNSAKCERESLCET